MITDLGHAAFAAHDLQRSLDFYALLGIHEAFRLHRDDNSLMLVYLHVAGDRFIEVFPNGPDPALRHPGSFMHLCLISDDIQGMVDHLRAAGVTITRDVVMGLDRNLQAWTTDPDGNAIELMQLADDSPQRRVARGEDVHWERHN